MFCVRSRVHVTCPLAVSWTDTWLDAENGMPLSHGRLAQFIVWINVDTLTSSNSFRISTAHAIFWVLWTPPHHMWRHYRTWTIQICCIFIQIKLVLTIPVIEWRVNSRNSIAPRPEFERERPLSCVRIAFSIIVQEWQLYQVSWGIYSYLYNIYTRA